MKGLLIERRVSPSLKIFASIRGWSYRISSRYPTSRSMTGCPQIHLKVDCGDMFQLGTDDPFFMKFFQKSWECFEVVYLVRPQSIEKLERSLGTAQSAFKMELGPEDRWRANVPKEHSEAFTEYAFRWREAASRLKNPMTEEEMMNISFTKLPLFNQFTSDRERQPSWHLPDWGEARS